MTDDVRKATKSAMSSAKITQQQLADHLGVDRVYVNQMLNGVVSNAPERWISLLDQLGYRLTIEKK